MALESFGNLSFGSVNISAETLLLAVVVAVLGVVAARIIAAVFRRVISRSSRLPELIIEFLVRFFSALLYVIVILLVLAALGIDVGSMVLGLSAIIGLVLGFGLQDSFTNFAAGVWIATLRPIDKGEFVEVNGMSGTVQAVGMMATELLTIDNKYITIPNALVWGSPVINYTRMDTRRADVPVGIGYGSNVDEAVRIAMELMQNHPGVLADPAPSVVVTGLGDSSVNLSLRAWTNTGDLWTVIWDLNRDILAAYRNAGIEIPFPQMDVHLDR
ncbi:MAG: mechanosensitive ion channel family protein [Methanomicrobiaceae archaeon]|nr:mechanosensitive ion channel family protein [Methanomicrobiaceae archaeon]